MLLLVFIFRFVVTVVYTYLFVYIIELFPTQVRVLGTGVFNTTGAISITLCHLFIHFCINHGVSIMAFLVVSCVLNVYLSTLLPETLGKRTEEEVEELRRVGTSLKEIELEEIRNKTGERLNYGENPESFGNIHSPLLDKA